MFAPNVKVIDDIRQEEIHQYKKFALLVFDKTRFYGAFWAPSQCLRSRRFFLFLLCVTIACLLYLYVLQFPSRTKMYVLTRL